MYRAEGPTRAMAEFNFSAAPVGSEPCVIELIFQNTGHAACDWSVSDVVKLVIGRYLM